MRTMLLITAALVITAALGAGGAAAAPAAPERIVYETGPCFGFCPTYQVTVDANVQGLFEGQRFTAVKGRRRFHFSPAQFVAFRDRLKLDRPVGTRRLSGDACRSMATDQITVTIRWSGGRQPPAQLSAYFGCDMDRNAALFRRLATAPQLLPIAAFIGAPQHPR